MSIQATRAPSCAHARTLAHTLHSHMRAHSRQHYCPIARTQVTHLEFSHAQKSVVRSLDYGSWRFEHSVNTGNARAVVRTCAHTRAHTTCAHARTLASTLLPNRTQTSHSCTIYSLTSLSSDRTLSLAHTSTGSHTVSLRNTRALVCTFARTRAHTATQSHARPRVCMTANFTHKQVTHIEDSHVV